MEMGLKIFTENSVYSIKHGVIFQLKGERRVLPKNRQGPCLDVGTPLRSAWIQEGMLFFALEGSIVFHTSLIQKMLVISGGTAEDECLEIPFKGSKMLLQVKKIKEVVEK